MYVSLVDYCPRVCKELDTTEQPKRLHTNVLGIVLMLETRQ